MGQDSIQGFWREQRPADTLISASGLQNCCLKPPVCGHCYSGPRTDTQSVSIGNSRDAAGWPKGHPPCSVCRGHSGWRRGSGQDGGQVGGDRLGERGVWPDLWGDQAESWVESSQHVPPPHHGHLLGSQTWGTDKGPSSRAQVDKFADLRGPVGSARSDKAPLGVVRARALSRAHCRPPSFCGLCDVQGQVSTIPLWAQHPRSLNWGSGEGIRSSGMLGD